MDEDTTATGTVAPESNGAPKNAAQLRDRILSARDSTTRIIHVKAWDVDVEIHSMTGKERSEITQIATDPDTGELDHEVLYPLVLIRTVFDPVTHERVFTEHDADAINARSAGALEVIATAAYELSGLGSEVRKALGKASLRRSAGTRSS